MTPTKGLKDQPQFLIAAVKQLQTNDDGEIDLEIYGTFDRISGVYEGKCALPLPERECLVGDLKFVDVDAKSAVFLTSEQSIPSLVGLRIPYLPDRWHPSQVWMVIEPEWIWTRVLFQAKDARAQRFEAKGVSIIDGQEVREWIEITKVGEESEGARYCPVYPDGRVNLPDAGPGGIIKGGWNHEHCDICREHIDAGQYGFVDRSGQRLCERCHGQYVATHDLSFLDQF